MNEFQKMMFGHSEEVSDVCQQVGNVIDNKPIYIALVALTANIFKILHQTDDDNPLTISFKGMMIDLLKKSKNDINNAIFTDFH